MRAIQNAALQRELSELIEQAKTVPPGPDENGQMVQLDIMLMFLDRIKLSKLPDTEKYKIPWVPPPIALMGPEGQPGAEGPKEVGVTGT